MSSDQAETPTRSLHGEREGGSGIERDPLGRQLEAVAMMSITNTIVSVPLMVPSELPVVP